MGSSNKARVGRRTSSPLQLGQLPKLLAQETQNVHSNEQIMAADPADRFPSQHSQFGRIKSIFGRNYVRTHLSPEKSFLQLEYNACGSCKLI
jgi:hypothetical protein